MVIPGAAVAAKYLVKHGAKKAGFSDGASDRMASAAKFFTIICTLDLLSIPIDAAVTKHRDKTQQAEEDKNDNKKARSMEEDNTKLKKGRNKKQGEKKDSSLVGRVLQFLMGSLQARVEGLQRVESFKRHFAKARHHWPKIKVVLGIMLAASAIVMLCMVIASVAVTFRLVAACIASIMGLFF